MDLPSTQLLNDDYDTSSSQSFNSSQCTPKRVHQIANLHVGIKKYPVFKGINSIGRHPASDICINDLSISKNHAELEVKSNCYYICDLKSSNKTRIENEPLRPERFYQIVDGSRLTFGIINAQFLLLRDDNNSIIVPETPEPTLRLRADGNNSTITDSDDSAILGTQEANDENVFAKPTNWPIRSPSTRDARTKNLRKQLNTSIHDIETQAQSSEGDDPSIFESATQQMVDTNKKTPIYDIETQQSVKDEIKNEVFDEATQRLPEKTDVESDIYSTGTQIINSEENRGIYNLDTQKMDSRNEASSVYDVATQLNAVDDDMYNCETQRINNKQFGIIISKVKKSRVSNKSSNGQKEVAVLQKNGIKNGEEDDGKQQQVSKVNDDSETDDELIDELQQNQSSSVNPSSSGIIIDSKKPNDNDKVSSTSVNENKNIIIDETDESESDDEDAVIDHQSRVHCEVNIMSELNDKKSNNNEAGSYSENNDEEELAEIKDKRQSKTSNDNKNDNGSETDDEILPSNEPVSSDVTSIDSKKSIDKRIIDSEAGNTTSFSPVLFDFSKIQQPGTEYDEDETDDDEVYMTPNQAVSPNKKVPSTAGESGLERYDTASSETAKPAVGEVSPRKDEFECDPDALTQIIPSSTNTCDRGNKLSNNRNDCEVGDDFAPTQLINPQNNCNDDDETDDEELELLRNQTVDKNQGNVDELESTQMVNSANKNSALCDQDLNDAPTQLLDLDTQIVHRGVEDTQKILEVQDDLEPTQLIDSQSGVPSVREMKKNSQPVKTNNQSRDKDQIDDEFDDLENAPTQIINFDNSENTRNLKNDNLDGTKSDRVSHRASPTPISSVTKKTSSAMKNLQVSLDKLTDEQLTNSNKKNKIDDKKVYYNKKREFKNTDNKNDKLNSSNDSIVKNLDAMFGSSNDDELENELEDAIPLQTQQLEEILSDVPEKLHNVNNFQKSGSQDNKINLRIKKTGESKVDSRPLTPDTQDTYFTKLISKKKKTNVLVDSQGSSTSQTSVKSKGKTEKELVYAPGTIGFLNGDPVESNQSVGAYESPEKKLKSKAKEKDAKSKDKPTVDPVNEDDFFAGLPDVQIAGTSGCSENASVASSDDENYDNYSTGHMIKKLQKSMAEVKDTDSDDDDDGVFSHSKLIVNQSKSSITHTDIELPKIKNFDDDDDSSDGEVDFARLKQLADRLLNANDKKKILTGLKEVSSNSKNNKKQVNEEKNEKVNERKSSRKRGPPQKFKEDVSSIDSISDNENPDSEAPAKRPRKARKNSKSSTPNKLTTSISEQQEVVPKKKAVTRRPKKTIIDDSLTNDAVNSSTEATVKAKKRPATKKTEKMDTDQSEVNISTSSTASSTLDSTLPSKVPRTSVMDSPSASARSRHMIHPLQKLYKIMFTGINYEEHEEAIQSLGGVINNDDAMAGTVLVTDKVRRTLKFICSISRSIPIVSEEWIKASIKNKKFVGTDQYLLTDPAAESKYGFNLKNTLIRSKEKKLLHNLTFIITAGVNQPSVNELKTMIQAAGGKALVRAPRSWTPNTYIISCDADIKKVQKLTANLPDNIEVPIVKTEFILSGILRQQLNVEEHKLCA